LDFTAVATASAALAVAGASRIDVLVADVLLGEDTTGIELAKQLVARQPGLSLVLMSGYTADHFDLSGLPEHTQFLTKPFTTDALTHCLAVARNRSASPEG
jgi:CheY-like chemotaxis protein